MRKKTSIALRGIRKGANLSKKYSSKAVNFSARIENKANRILNGTDPTVQLHDSVLIEKVLSGALPEIVPIHPALPKAGRSATVTLLIPSLQNSSFFGGTATALIVAALASKISGKKLRIIETLVHGNGKPSDLTKFLDSSDIGWAGEDVILESLAGRNYNHYGYLDIHPEDVYIASAWWDAYSLQKLPLQNKFIYLIQDFEPIFYNNSDRYALSEATYRSNQFIALCNTKLMYDFMKSHNYKSIVSGEWFEPAVSRKSKIKRTERRKTAKRKLFLYGRPGVERNLYITALNALDFAFSNNYLDSADWEVVMAGQDNLPDIQLSTGMKIKNLGKMNLSEYFKLLSTIDIAVSPMMAPHPNYPTLEFASTGAVVVTTRYDIKQDLSNYSKNIILTDISAEAMALGIKKASEMPLEKIKENLEQTNIESDWPEALNKPVREVLGKVSS